jgi:hypothetical protein
MAQLDPHDLLAYARRDWSAPERLARASRARVAVTERMRLAVALYEAARATRPGWPSDADRRADFAHHLRLRALLDTARHVGTR